MEKKKQSEKSPVQNLQESISLVINLQANNLAEIAVGKIPEIPIDTKMWDAVIKVVELMPKFKLFEVIIKGEADTIKKITGDDHDDVAVMSVIEGNAFEERSKIIKEKLNGKTAIGTKKN